MVVSVDLRNGGNIKPRITVVEGEISMVWFMMRKSCERGMRGRGDMILRRKRGGVGVRSGRGIMRRNRVRGDVMGGIGEAIEIGLMIGDAVESVAIIGMEIVEVGEMFDTSQDADCKINKFIHTSKAIRHSCTPMIGDNPD